MSSEIKRRGLMLVLSSPSGAGKTTITRRLMELDPNLSVSVSVTTRTPRPGEVDGVHYHFIDKSAFDRMVVAGELLEYATVFGNSYGTPRRPVEALLKQGRDVVFDIDWQGTQQMRAAARDDLVTVFVLPPNAAELERRLRNRAQDSESVIQGRMTKASDEISHWSEYDYVIINHDLDNAIETVRTILRAERMKRHRQLWLVDFIRDLRKAVEH